MKVLMVDMDPQAHLKAGSGVSPYKLEVTIYDVMKGEADPRETVINLNDDKGRLVLLPSSISLAAADFKLVPYYIIHFKRFLPAIKMLSWNVN